ncbi:MAG: hypothetical protein QOF89_5372 [Acidobacteriota bacterium]|jgi:hypothetical protein|nr:hypothetical protein [Acidobacteriota bacterium]
MDIAGIWNHVKYTLIQGEQLLFGEKYELQILRDPSAPRDLLMRFQDPSGNPKEVRGIDSGSHLCVFGWIDEPYTYSGTAFASRFNRDDVLVGIIERKLTARDPYGTGDSDMGSFTATKPIGGDDGTESS